MSAFGRTALLCGVSFLAAAVNVVGMPAYAQSGPATHTFSIPPKPLLAALADFTAQTGIQVVRPSAERVGGTAQGVSGQYSAEAALRILLTGTGLSFHVTGPRTVSLYGAGGDESAFVPASDAVVLEPIDVSGAAANDAAFQGIGRVEIGEAELRQTNPTDLQGVFAGEPGVTVGSSLPISQKVYVHGVEETNLAVTIDGGRQNQKVFHHNGTNFVDPLLLKSVRVDAGVAPADAGPGALAGSIAYETKDVGDLLLPGKNFGGFAKLSLDSNSLTVTQSGSLYGRHNGFEALGYINIGNGEEFEDGTGQKVLGSETNFVSGIGKLAYESTEGHRFELSHDRLHDDADRPFRANMTNADPVRPWNPTVRRYVIDRQNTVFSYTDTSAEGWWDPKIVLAYSRTDVDVDQFQPGVVPPTYDYTSQGEGSSLNGKVENKFALAFGSVTAGVDFYSDEISYTDPDNSLVEKAQNVGLYAQVRLEPWERTRLSFGGRADQQWFEGLTGEEFDNAGLSGNLSAEYDITDFLTAKAGASHVWAGVPLAESYLMHPDWDYGTGPEPVTANNLNAGLVARYEGFSFEAGVFRTEINDARAAVRYAASVALRSFDLETEGFEIGAGYEWGNGFVRVKYANIDAKLDGAPADTYLGSYLTAPVGEVITVQAAHTFEEWNLTLGANAEFALDYDGLRGVNLDGEIGQTVPGYEVVNLFAEYVPASFENLTLRLDINNIFDETYIKRGTYGQEYPSVAPLNEAGRSFLLSARAQF